METDGINQYGIKWESRNIKILLGKPHHPFGDYKSLKELWTRPGHADLLFKTAFNICVNLFSVN